MEYRVSGKVTSASRPGVGSLRVVVVDKNIGADVIVAETTTDADGMYQVDFSYTGQKQKPDLQARVFIGETFLGASVVCYNASSPVALAILIDQTASAALPSEYETLIAALAKQFDGRLRDLQEAEDRRDITYLANKTGWDARAIAIAVLAEQFSADSVDANGAAIEPPFFYALFRAGLPTDQHALYHTKLQMVAANWKQAIAAGTIPVALETSLPQALEQFKRLAVDRILGAPALRGVSSLNEMLALPFGDDPDQQRKFVELYVEHGTDLQEFWKAAEREFSESVERLKLNSELGNLTLFNAPLIRTLNTGNRLNSALQLVEEGFYQADKWEQAIGDEAIPPDIPGKDTSEKRTRYAELLAARVRVSSPTAVVAQMVKGEKTPLSNTRLNQPRPNIGDLPPSNVSPANAELKGELKDQVHEHLMAQAGKFNIGAQPIEQYLAQNDLEWPTEVTQEVTRIQRVYQIAPSDTAMNALLAEGVDSASTVLSYDRDTFVETFKDKVGGETDAALIYAKAEQVHSAVVNIATSYLIARSAPAIGLVEGENRANYLDTMPTLSDHPLASASGSPALSGVIAYPTLEGLFGEMDYCACEHCRSILSPAAYLVDLLQFLDRDVTTQPASLNPYKVLIERRPDIPQLPLTCANTNTTLPYIDLVNETLEFFVSNKSLDTYPGQTTDEQATPDELAASPQPNIINGVNHTDRAHQSLYSSIFPPPLPFSWRLENIRRYFGRFDSSLAEAMQAMRKNDNLERPSEGGQATVYGWRDILMEELRLAPAEYDLLTTHSATVVSTIRQLLGYTQTLPDDAELLLELLKVKPFTRRVGISYEDISEIVKARFVNPNAALIPRLERLGVSFRRLRELKENSSTGQSWLNLLPQPLPDAAQYGGNIEAWLKNEANFANIVSIITLADPTDEDNLCSFDDLRFLYANPDPAKQKLRPFEFIRLIRFIRLWKKLGWTIDQTDKAITALYPGDQAPTSADDAQNLAKLDAGFLVLLPRLGMLKRLMNTLGLEPDRDLLPLLACFAPIDAYGDRSLYRQMFLRPSFLERYPVFAEDGFGHVPSRSEPLTNYVEALRSAFQLTGDEYEQIRSALRFNAETRLTLDAMSAIFRRAWLARQLQLSVHELLQFIKFTGLDPFAMPDPPDAGAQPARGQPGIVRLIELVSRLRNTALQPEQALYLLWNEDLSGTSAPQEREILELARTLRAGLAAVESDLAITDDPDGRNARAKMALVYGNETSETFFSFVDSTFVSEVAYSHDQATLEQAILDVVRGRIAYDSFHKRLSFAGVLTETLSDALKGIAGVTDAFKDAVDQLFDKNQQIVGPFFARYPELLPLHDAYIASNNPVEQKRAALLANFLPELKRRRKREQAFQAFSAVAKDAAELAISLLDTKVGAQFILHAANDQTRPILDDLTALEQTADLSKDVLVFAVEPPFASWSGYVAAPEDGLYLFRIEVDPLATVTLTLDGVPQAGELADATWTTNSPSALRAGTLVRLAVNVDSFGEQFTVQWQAAGRGWKTIPPQSLYSDDLIARLRTTYIRSLKIASVAAGLRLTANEIVHFALLEVDPADRQGWLNSLRVDGIPNTTTSALVFRAFRALLDYAVIKAELSPDDERLLAVLQAPVAATERPESLLFTLAGWDKGALGLLLAHFGIATVADLAQIDTFRRIYDTFALLKKLGTPVPALISAAHNLPLHDDSAFLSALRARHNAGDWLQVLKPINDEMRILQRDALVAYILHKLRSDPKTEHIDTPDKLFEYLLMDVQMDPCMQTSRILHTLSSIQLFIHRCLMNLEPQVAPSAIRAKQWEWMKRYRVWEANRKVFLYPENWLEPELRDDASPLFKETMSELLQGDITDDRAAEALANYLAKLEEIAKLEPCNIFYAPNDAGKPADDIAHVVARTAGANRKYFYRRREGGSWTPWEQITLDIEDNPVLPVVWKGRLLLFWFKLLKEPKSSELPAGSLTALSTSQIQPKALMNVKAVLCWSEYFNGAWQATKTSDVDHPLVVAKDIRLSSEPEQITSSASITTILPVVLDLQASTVEQGESLRVLVQAQLGRTGEYELHNTHSLPDQKDAGSAGPGSTALRTFSKQGANPEVFLDIFTIIYTGYSYKPLMVLQSKYEDSWIQPRHAINEIDWQLAPFFYEDARNIFYVSTLFVKPKVPDPISPPTIPVDPCEENPGLCSIDIEPPIYYSNAMKGAVRFGDQWIGPNGALRGVDVERSRDRITLTAIPARRLAGSQTIADDISQLSYTEMANMKHIYLFETFYHPFVGELIKQLNQKSLPGLLDPNFHEQLEGGPSTDGQDSLFAHYDYQIPHNPADPDRHLVSAEGSPKKIDVAVGGPYSNYNWELLFHIPLAIAVHLSKNQRFAEAQRWFHFIFDPTSNEPTPAPRRFWRFLAFRKLSQSKPIDELLALLSKSNLTREESKLRDQTLAGYEAIKNNPFQPHLIARTRPVAYQYSVVMKYLDNLIAWGDSLFRQDTIESLNEATQLYVLAANILGPRPQRLPVSGRLRSQSYAQIKERLRNQPGIGDPLVELESKFPFNIGLPQSGGANPGATSQLFGIGRALFFCIPPNEKLLGYWDMVADRLFKIRHCMNIDGIIRQLALFEPPLDPGMLVKAAAAGIDVAAAISGMQQPVSPVRSLFLIQKALELCGEVRSLGAALLAAIEKGDNEHIALLRQGHEVKIQQMQQEVRFLQWKQAQEATEALRESRGGAMRRYRYYMRLLDETPDDDEVPFVLALDRRELTAENFDTVHAALVNRYTRGVSGLSYPPLRLAASSSPTNQSGVSGVGNLYLTNSENAELNNHLPRARDLRNKASTLNTIATVLTYIPDFTTKVAPLGIGIDTLIFGGAKLADALKIGAEIISTEATWEQDQAGIASRTAGYERRADEWILQVNLAAHELDQIGQQLIGALIAEQVARHEYLTITKQIQQSQEAEQFLREKFTNEQLYAWMQGETSRLYYEYYRFAFDTARRAEQAMKRELMRPELDATDYVKFNYWDSGRKGLLSGEALYLDVKRMELAYHDNNRRELELTRHVSLRQLDPVALLTLKATGACQMTIPEWLYDMDCPGHYMRRIKSVALSIPSVVGPYTSVNCTLSLLKSSLRIASIAGDDYLRRDDRFREYTGAIQSIVTSSGQNDSGLFEANLHDERILPFEGAGAESTWKLELPKDYRAFDYATIADVILHIRYTARQGVDPTSVKKALDTLFAQADQANQASLALLFSLRQDFSTEWSAFVSSGGAFTATIRRDHFPYITQGKAITITGYDLYEPDGANPPKHRILGDQGQWTAATADLKSASKQSFIVTASKEELGVGEVLTRTMGAQVFLIIRYALRAV